MRLLTALLFAAFAHAEVLDSAAGGFTVKTTVNIKAAPEDVYRKLVHDIGEWWSPIHTFSGDAHNLRIEDRPGGCLCEKLAHDGFARHLEVIAVEPGKRILMSGAMGPMQTMAATGTLQFQVTPAEGGTKLDAIYAIGGYFPKGTNTWTSPVDRMLTDQCARLKSYVETGHAESK
jgi:uncharacterized protein YndB with AHSA1/START domain